MSSDKVGLDVLNDSTPIDLTTVRTAAPILKPALHMGILSKAELEQNSKKTGFNLNLELKLVNSAETEDGKTVDPGFSIYDTISLVKTFKESGDVSYDPAQRLVAVIEAVTGEKTGNMTYREMVSAVQGLIGRQVSFRTVIEDDEKYGKKTRLARYVKAA